MQTDKDNRRQSQQDPSQRDDIPTRSRESGPAGRQDPGTAGESGATRGGSTQQFGQTGGARGASMQPLEPSGGQRAQRSNFGLARRDQDYGYPSLFSGGGPFALLRRMEQEMDRMFEQLGLDAGGYAGQSRSRGSGMPSLWAPQIEMYERDGKLHVCTDLPGMKKEDIHVNVEDDVITIQGERRSSEEGRDQQQGFYRSERSYGSFYRTIPLPEGVNAENAEATFRDGVLDIAFDAPTGQKRGRTLEISDGPSQSSQPASVERNRRGAP